MSNSSNKRVAGDDNPLEPVAKQARTAACAPVLLEMTPDNVGQFRNINRNILPFNYPDQMYKQMSHKNSFIGKRNDAKFKKWLKNCANAVFVVQRLLATKRWAAFVVKQQRRAS